MIYNSSPSTRSITVFYSGWSILVCGRQMKPIISRGHSTEQFCFLVFSVSRRKFGSYDHVRHTKIISRTFLTNPWKRIFDLRFQIFFWDLRSSRAWAFSQPWHPKWVKSDLKNFRKSIFEVKKIDFSFYVRKSS